MQRDTGSYTVDPASRYPNLNRTAVSPYQVKTLIDSDDPKVFEQPIAEIITTPALAEAPALLRKSRRSTGMSCVDGRQVQTRSSQDFGPIINISSNNNSSS